MMMQCNSPSVGVLMRACLKQNYVQSDCYFWQRTHLTVWCQRFESSIIVSNSDFGSIAVRKQAPSMRLGSCRKHTHKHTQKAGASWKKPHLSLILFQSRQPSLYDVFWMDGVYLRLPPASHCGSVCVFILSAWVVNGCKCDLQPVPHQLSTGNWCVAMLKGRQSLRRARSWRIF